MYTQLRKYDQIITRDFALEVATHPKWKGERDLRQSRLDMLRGELEAGRFYSPVWVFAWLDGKKLRVNGQHSSTMLAAAGDKFPSGLVATVLEFLCESENDVAELFSTFDRPESARNLHDTLGTHACIHPELKDVSARTIAKATSGVLTAMKLTKRLKGNVTRDDRARVLHTDRDFISWGAKILASRLIEREAVAAGVYLTYEKAPSEAMEFWAQVIDGSAPSNRHPTRVLQLALLSMKTSAERGNRQTRWPVRAIVVKCIHAWNAFCDGREIADLKYYADAEFPEVKAPRPKPLMAIA